MQPKIHILYRFKEGPWGGGNQFLKSLKKYFVSRDYYVNLPKDADVILFNSHQEVKSVLKLKRKYPKKVFIHRVDGPIAYTRNNDLETDKIIFSFNQAIANGTIFQSKWSQDKSYEQGIKRNSFETVITNAPDPKIFYPQKSKKLQCKKIKLIATSWSSNAKKGFDIYDFLDKNLDFDKYEMTFVGNSPIKFKQIQQVLPQPSYKLAEILRQHDIFITASRNDPCSNALIEGLHCGLPSIARNDGGHPEIIDEAGELFEDEQNILNAIENVAQNYPHYHDKIKMATMEDVGKMYYEFVDQIYRCCLNGTYNPKQINKIDLLIIWSKIFKWNAISKIEMGKRLLKVN